MLDGSLDRGCCKARRKAQGLHSTSRLNIAPDGNGTALVAVPAALPRHSLLQRAPSCLSDRRRLADGGPAQHEALAHQLRQRTALPRWSIGPATARPRPPVQKAEGRSSETCRVCGVSDAESKIVMSSQKACVCLAHHTHTHPPPGEWCAGHTRVLYSGVGPAR